MASKPKPRLFIGSSVEGLTIAYAIQDNLQHNAEVTVWPQGAFDLSKTTIESLIKILNSFDFGIFVFSPDDITKMRGRTKVTVRDNVIFELGLFIGKLGRERVFIVVPENNEKLHIPTDLLGVTPGKFETSRSDNNLHSATASFCNQVRSAITLLGRLPGNDSIIISNENRDENKSLSLESELKIEVDWVDLFNQRNYNEALEIINKLLLEEQSDKSVKKLTIGLLRCKLNINFKDGLLAAASYEEKNTPTYYSYVISAYVQEGFFEQAEATIETSLTKYPGNSLLTIAKADALITKGFTKDAIECLQSLEEPSEAATTVLCDLLIEQKQYYSALYSVHKAFLQHPASERVAMKFASIAQEVSNYKLSLFLYDMLSRRDPTSAVYLTLMAGAAMHLKLYDIAITSYRKAVAITDGKDEWILSNLGNVLKIVGALEDAKDYFKKSLALFPEDAYAFNRLSQIMEAQAEETKKHKAYVSEGRAIAFSASLTSPSEEEDDDNDLPF